MAMSDETTSEPTGGSRASEEPGAAGEPSGTERASGDLRDLLRHFAQPVIESLDARLRTQIDARVDERVAESVPEAVDAILASRLAVLERAVADLDRQLREVTERLHDAGD